MVNLIAFEKRPIINFWNFVIFQFQCSSIDFTPQHKCHSSLVLVHSWGINFGGTKITELKFVDWTSNFAGGTELNTSNKQIFTEIAELNVLQCKCEDFSIHSLTYQNNILKISRFRAIWFARHLLLSFVYNYKYYRKC